MCIGTPTAKNIKKKTFKAIGEPLLSVSRSVSYFFSTLDRINTRCLLVLNLPLNSCLNSNVLLWNTC